jgi:hypothetical protein
MSKMSIFAAISQSRPIQAIRQNRAIVADFALGIFLKIKGLFNAASVSDEVSKQFGINKSDLAIFQESLQKQLESAKSDSVATGDVLSVATGKALSDAASGADVFQRVVQYNKTFSNISVVSDAFQRIVVYNRSFSESLFATDDIGGEATIDDDQTIQFFKQLTNLSYVVDNVAAVAGKAVNDIITTMDSGVLLNQDYVDNPFYFAEDYVGVKRTF